MRRQRRPTGATTEGASMSMPIKATLCKNCPFRKSSPKAGELGGSVPISADVGVMRNVARNLTDGTTVMQCHKSSDRKPRPCAGYLSVVGFQLAGVRIGVAMGVIDRRDVGKPIAGLYSSLKEMMFHADHSVSAGRCAFTTCATPAPAI